MTGIHKFCSSLKWYFKLLGMPPSQYGVYVSRLSPSRLGFNSQERLSCNLEKEIGLFRRMDSRLKWKAEPLQLLVSSFVNIFPVCLYMILYFISLFTCIPVRVLYDGLRNISHKTTQLLKILWNFRDSMYGKKSRFIIWNNLSRVTNYAWYKNYLRVELCLK